MKLKLMTAAALLALALPALAQVQVRGHYRKDGTYVQPHIRSAPNRTKSDNYGSYGSSSGQSSYQPTYVSPYSRDKDNDGVSNQHDSDDDNDGTLDDYDSDPR